MTNFVIVREIPSKKETNGWRSDNFSMTGLYKEIAKKDVIIQSHEIVFDAGKIYVKLLCSYQQTQAVATPVK